MAAPLDLYLPNEQDLTMFIELGICIGLLAAGNILTRNVSAISATDGENLLAEALDRKRKRKTTEEEAKAVEDAEAKVQAYLDQVGLAFRMKPLADSKLTADTFLRWLPARKQKAVVREVKCREHKLIETQAYLALSHRKGGGRHDA